MRHLIYPVLFLAITSCHPDPEQQNITFKTVEQDSIRSASVLPQFKFDAFGFRIDSLNVSDLQVRRNESLYKILTRYDFSPQEVYSITQKAKEVMNVRAFKPGQNYRVYASLDSDKHISGLVWQPNAVEYVVFNWRDSLNIYRSMKEVTIQERAVSAVITRSLYETMAAKNLSPVLTYKLSEIYAWEIDFFSLRDGDLFKMIYQNKYVDDTFYEIGEILAVEFSHQGESHFAYQFEGDGVSGFFDENGNSVQKALLKTPFRFDQRISSGFSRSRFHPVLKRRMPHYGVDYAAPYGTPVLSVGDGTVTEAGYRGANGNIIKIRHNRTYETAYLHLSGFARGIRKGVHVEQGQIIGYVGHTGRVTGTHLDYRIYRNNRPVNPSTVDLPASESIPSELMKKFKKVRDRFNTRLENIKDL